MSLIKELKLVPDQQEFIKYGGFSSSYNGWGSTYAGCIKSLRQALEFEKSKGIIAAPSQQILYNVVMGQFFKLLQVPYSLVPVKNTVRFANESEIRFISLQNPGRILGIICNWVWFDCKTDGNYFPKWELLKNCIRLPETTVGMNKAWITGIDL